MIPAEYLSLGGAAVCGLVGVKMAASAMDSLLRYSAEWSRIKTQSQGLRAQLARQARLRESANPTQGWQGWRKFRVESKVQEAKGCHSLTFVPHDGHPISSFEPGQFLTFSVRIPGAAKPLVRCYSLSDAPRPDAYRCTIKKVVPPSQGLPPGRMSTYFNDVIQVGDIVDVKAPSGKFFLDMSTDRPIVLIAGGVGITPMISMVNAVVNAGARRSVHLFCGFRNRQEHLFYDHLKSTFTEHANLHLHVAYSQPTDQDTPGRDYHVKGYVDLELLRQRLPSNNYDFYLCGPPSFMDSVESALKTWGVPDTAIKSEAFGPASKNAVRNAPTDPVDGRCFSIEFTRSGKTVTWNGEAASILDLADEQGIPVDSGCRAGNCATCVLAIRAGKVRHTETPDAPVSEGTCLSCLAVPESDLKLDA